MVTDAPVRANNASPVPGIQISRSKSQPKVLVIWWSSKTIRLAQQRLRQLSNPAQTTEPLRAEELPDYVLVIEGREPLRILQGAKEDLHDTVFLQLANGTMLDLESVRFFDGNEQEEPRVEFHFPKQIEGQATLDQESDRIVFHCTASAKVARLATIIRSHFALNSSRMPCAFTVCLIFEGEKLDYSCEKFCVGDVGQGAIKAGVAYFSPKDTTPSQTRQTVDPRQLGIYTAADNIVPLPTKLVTGYHF